MRPPPEHKVADLAIVGGGAAGLMAAITAAQAGLRPVLIERKHKPGRKLLMCGNARCNLTNMLPAGAFLAELGEPVGPFVQQAIEQFPPTALRQWFKSNGLNTIEKRGGRVFPASERASDVLNLLQDLLRKHEVPLLLNSPVERLTHEDDRFTLATPAYSLTARRVLICTGGVTYPKTGSVGDGQKLAAAHGMAVTPYRPGLVGLQVNLPCLAECADTKFEDCTAIVTLADSTTVPVAGDIELQRWGICGGLVSNATRLAARANSTIAALEVDLLPQSTPAELSRLFADARTPHQALKKHFRDVPPRFWYAILPEDASRSAVANALHRWSVPIAGTRPLKEAMVTVGGVSLAHVDPTTMEARACPGLYLAGEVLDIDGPTGGFNLQLAFSTARLAIAAMVPNGLSPTPRPHARGRGGSSKRNSGHGPQQDRYRHNRNQRRGSKGRQQR